MGLLTMQELSGLGGPFDWLSARFGTEAGGAASARGAGFERALRDAGARRAAAARRAEELSERRWQEVLARAGVPRQASSPRVRVSRLPGVRFDRPVPRGTSSRRRTHMTRVGPSARQQEHASLVSSRLAARQRSRDYRDQRRRDQIRQQQREQALRAQAAARPHTQADAAALARAVRRQRASRAPPRITNALIIPASRRRDVRPSILDDCRVAGRPSVTAVGIAYQLHAPDPYARSQQARPTTGYRFPSGAAADSRGAIQAYRARSSVPLQARYTF